MGQLRIQGLVRLANRVRRELSGPVSERRVGELRQLVDDSLRHVERICAEHQTTPEQLPGPSRKAYRYLAGLDWSQVAATAEVAGDDAEPTSPRRQIRFTGLQKSIDEFADALSRPDPPEAGTVHQRIADLSGHIEQQIDRDGLGADELTEPTRQARGWLALLAQREYFDAYVHAVALAEPVFRRAVEGSDRYAPPVFIEYRPIKPPAKAGGTTHGTRVQLQTPMIGFDRGEHEAVADAVIHRRHDREQLYRAMTGEAYQAVRAELEALAGVVEQPQGTAHDLAAAFDRVNQDYFDRRHTRPQLTWSNTFTGRKFGHYDPVHDTVMVSATLDQHEVPALVVDFLVYHELLHRERGIAWHNGRAQVHDADFEEAERRFEQYHRAQQVLDRLAQGR